MSSESTTCPDKQFSNYIENNCCPYSTSFFLQSKIIYRSFLLEKKTLPPSKNDFVKCSDFTKIFMKCACPRKQQLRRRLKYIMMTSKPLCNTRCADFWPNSFFASCVHCIKNSCFMFSWIYPFTASSFLTALLLCSLGPLRTDKNGFAKFFVFSNMFVTWQQWSQRRRRKIILRWNSKKN